MKTIEELRKNINEVDQDIAKLFEKRMNLVKDVALYKKEHALPIYDNAREIKVIENNQKYIEDEVIKEYYTLMIKHMMKVSKDYQERLLTGMKIAYSGIEGAFAHIMATKMFKNATYIPFKDFLDAYKAVENGVCDACVLPLENSYAGDVGVVMDLIFQGNLYINQVAELEVSQNLVAKKGSKLANIKKIISHPQALDQCNEYIKKHGFTRIEALNTAVAAKEVANSNDETLAGIASIDTAKLYDLEILEKNINESSFNTTRFGAFSKILDQTKKETPHFIIVFTVKNEAGALAKMLNIIGSHGFNMRSLRSRPMKELMWNYYFYCEIEGDINDPDSKEMLRALSIFCDKLKIVGTY